MGRYGVGADSGAERRGQQRETASPMVLHCVVGEAVKAHRECPGDIRKSKCAARVRAALTVART